MKHKKPSHESISDTDLTTICRQLANKKKWLIITYLHSAKYATATVIVRKLSLNQSTVCKAIQSLTQTGLLTREKVGSSIIYQLNEKTWSCVSDHFAKLAG